MSRVRLRHLAQVNPPCPAFGNLSPDDELTFVPMEAVWPGSRLDLSERRSKASVASGYTRFQDGDVLVPKITPTFEAGRSVLISDLHNGVGAGTTELHVLRAGCRLDARYLLYIVNTHHFLKFGEAEMYGVAGQKRVPDDFLRDLVVDLPPLAEQRRIADFLDGETSQIDRLQSARLQQLVLLKERELALIYACISGADVPGERLRTGWSWLASIPARWRIAPVYSQYEVRLGKMLNQERTTGDHLRPYLRNANVTWYSIDTSDLLFMDFPPQDVRRYSIRTGDLLVCEGGAGMAEAAVWTGVESPMFYQKSLHRVRRTSDLPVEWLMYWLRIAKAVGDLAARGNQEENPASISHLTGEQLRGFRIPVPGDAETRVKRMSEGIEHLQKAMRALQAAKELALEWRQALISAAVTGQIDVTTARGVRV